MNSSGSREVYGHRQASCKILLRKQHKLKECRSKKIEKNVWAYEIRFKMISQKAYIARKHDLYESRLQSS